MKEENKITIYDPAGTALDRPRSNLLMPPDPLKPAGSSELMAYWRVIRARRWTILSILLIVVSVVLIGTLKEKPEYEASTLLEIEKENPNILTVQDLFQLENVSDAYLETQYEILRSDTLARNVIEQLQLNALPEFNPPRRWWQARRKPKAATAANEILSGGSFPPNAEELEDTIHVFENHLTVDPIRRSRLVEIRFDSHDPALAARIVNTLADDYVDENLQLRWDATQKASGWLSQQLAGIKIKLEKSEEEMQQYAQANGLLYLENEQGTPENIVDERLRQLQEELTKAQADRYAKESLYRQAEAGEYDALPGIADNLLMQNLTLRLSDLETSYAQLSTIFSPDYPKVKQAQNQIDQVQAILARQRQRAVERITNDYFAALQREKLIGQAFELQQAAANQVAQKAVQYNILKREVDTNKQLYEGLLQRMKEAGVSAGLKASNIRIVDAAVPPDKPSRPNLPLNLALALVVGASLGIGAAFLQQHLDNTLKTSEDVEQYLQLPALALIPRAESLNGHHRVYGLIGRGGKAPEIAKIASGNAEAHWYRIDGLPSQYGALAEAFRSLRTSVLLSTADRPPRSLLITSAQPAEGKTTVTCNLAISLAQLGQRVLLVDCDMRRPCAHRIFGLTEDKGLVSYLTGQQDWRQAVRPTGVAGLDALFCGPVPPAPAELLSSERTRTLLREALEGYHFAVLDSPPVLNVADARILATLVEGVLLVVRGGFTPWELAQRARAHAHSVGANLIGVVLNNIDMERDGYYDGYRNYNYYGSTQNGSQEESST